MSGRVLFFGANNTTLKNEYTLGSGVGRKTISIRNALSKRAVIAKKYKQQDKLSYTPGRPRHIYNLIFN